MIATCENGELILTAEYKSEGAMLGRFACLGSVYTRVADQGTDRIHLRVDYGQLEAACALLAAARVQCQISKGY